MTHRLPQSYYRDIPAYVMDEIITGMIDGNQHRRNRRHLPHSAKAVARPERSNGWTAMYPEDY